MLVMNTVPCNVELIVKGDKNRVFETLTDIDGVLSVKLEKEETELSYFSVSVENIDEVKQAILYRLAEQKIPIYSM